MYRERLGALKPALKDLNLAALALLPGPSLKYLTGLDFLLMERPILGILPAAGRPVVVVPDLDRENAGKRGDLVDVFSYPERAEARDNVIQQAIQSLGLGVDRVGVEPLSMRYQEQNLLLAAAPGLKLVPAEEAVLKLRISKSDDEVEEMLKAVQIAEQALEKTLPRLRIGMTELDLANLLMVELLGAGSEPDLPFHPIVASGPNSALPHAGASRRKLQEGDILLIDWGARSAGYVSDITRTFCLGMPTDEMIAGHAAVLAGNHAGREAASAGVSCQGVDHAAREAIEARDLGTYFIHRTGHGLGLEAHEPPSIQGDNPQVLDVGMTFTVEPGVYLPDRWGIRIEDDLVITDSGARTLTSLDRDLRILG